MPCWRFVTWLLLRDNYVVFVIVVVVVVASVVDVTAAEFDVVVSADVAVVVFHLVAVVLALLVVATVISDFEIDDVDSAIVWGFLEIFADYFGDIDNIVESAVYRLHLGNLLDLVVFLEGLL